MSYSGNGSTCIAAAISSGLGGRRVAPVRLARRVRRARRPARREVRCRCGRSRRPSGRPERIDGAGFRRRARLLLDRSRAPAAPACSARGGRPCWLRLISGKHDLRRAARSRTSRFRSSRSHPSPCSGSRAAPAAVRGSRCRSGAASTEGRGVDRAERRSDQVIAPARRDRGLLRQSARRGPDSRLASASAGTRGWRDRRRQRPPPSVRYATEPYALLTQHYATSLGFDDDADLLKIDSSAVADD